MVLDNPRIYLPNNILAFRTMFMWGKYFVASFIFKQLDATEHLNLFVNFVDKHVSENDYLMTGNAMWQHHITDDNYKLGALAQRVFSVGHMGALAAEDIDHLLAALQSILGVEP